MNKIEGFIITESFDTNFFRLLLFCLYVKTFQKWIKKESNEIYSIIPDLFNFLISIVYSNSIKMNKQIKFEKKLIKTNLDFWKFYFIEIDIIKDDYKEFEKTFLFKLIKFISRFYLKCPSTSFNIQKF